MSDFFDQDTGEEFENDGMMERPSNTACILVNGSYQRVEEGSNFLNAVKNVARNAGFGKFKVYLNGIEVKPSSAPSEIRPEDRVEIRPFDEAG